MSRPVQWFLIVRRIARRKGTLFEVVSGSTDGRMEALVAGFGQARLLGRGRKEGLTSAGGLVSVYKNSPIVRAVFIYYLSLACAACLVDNVREV